MDKEKISFIKDNLFLLKEYQDLMESNITHLANKYREQLIKTASLFQFNELKELIHPAAESMEKDIIPRYIRGSFIIILWSFFEDSTIFVIKTINMYFRDPDTQNVPYDRLGRDFLTRAETFFGYRHPSDNIGDEFLNNIEKLKLIKEIRNNIVHKNLVVSEKDYHKLSTLIEHTPGLELSNNHLVVKEEFCDFAYTVVNDVLMDLLDDLENPEDPRMWNLDED